MTVLVQISIGSILLILCAAIHLAIVSRTLTFLRKHNDTPATGRPFAQLRWLSIALLAPVFSHTVHIYLWSFALLHLGALKGYETSIYFTLISYTTLGYGDVTLTPDFRILGAMSSVTGIIMFGITTAYLVAILGRMLDPR